MATARNQPQYDLISGSSLFDTDVGPPGQVTHHQATIPKPDASNEEWRVQIHRLQYEVESLRQEREAAALKYDDDLRRAQSRAEADSNRAKVVLLDKYAKSVL